MLTAEYGGTGGQPIQTGMVVEEPDIEIGAGPSSKGKHCHTFPAFTKNLIILSQPFIAVEEVSRAEVGTIQAVAEAATMMVGIGMAEDGRSRLVQRWSRRL